MHWIWCKFREKCTKFSADFVEKCTKFGANFDKDNREQPRMSEND